MMYILQIIVMYESLARKAGVIVVALGSAALASSIPLVIVRSHRAGRAAQAGAGR